MSWGFHLVWYSPFWQKISAWNTFQINLYQKLLTVEQKETHLAVDRDLLQCADDDANLMKTVITSDESWVYRYDSETKAQSSQWKTPGSPRPKKADQIWSKVKVMLTVFFYHEGVIPHEYAPDCQMLTRCTTTKLSVGCMVRCGVMDLRCGSEVTGAAPQQCPRTFVPPCPVLVG